MKKILVGVDSSRRQKDVLAAAVALATATGARLTLFHSVGLPPVLEPEAYTMAPSDIAPMLIANARAAVEASARDVPAGLIERIQVEVGVPWDAICRVAKEDDVDLIVIGSHGYAGLDKLIGTTAAKVVNHADRSVLVVRGPEHIVK